LAEIEAEEERVLRVAYGSAYVPKAERDRREAERRRRAFPEPRLTAAERQHAEDVSVELREWINEQHREECAKVAALAPHWTPEQVAAFVRPPLMLDHYESHDAEYRAMRDALGIQGGALAWRVYDKLRAAFGTREQYETDGDADDAADEADADRRAYFDRRGE
jgi:hypothetical protein